MHKDTQLIYGKNPVIEALKAQKSIEKLLVWNELRGELEMEVRALAKVHGVPISKIPSAKLNQLTNNQNHQGVAAILSPVDYLALQDVINKAFDEAREPMFLILEGISDVRNVGAIARSALVFGIEALVMPAKHTARINEDAIKISSGALLNMPVCREANMKIIIDTMKMNGIKVFASDLQADLDVRQADFSGPCAIVLGSEDRGITPETRKMADHLIKIQQHNDFDSLNVSVAAGILCYEATEAKKN